MTLREKETVSYMDNYPYYNHIIQDMPNFIEMVKSLGLDFVYDLNEATKYIKDDIFTNFWIHCNSLGNKICANYLVEFLRNKGKI